MRNKIHNYMKILPLLIFLLALIFVADSQPPILPGAPEVRKQVFEKPERGKLPDHVSGEIIVKFKEDPEVKERGLFSQVVLRKPKIETKFSSVNTSSSAVLYVMCVWRIRGFLLWVKCPLGSSIVLATDSSMYGSTSMMLFAISHDCDANMSTKFSS